MSDIRSRLELIFATQALQSKISSVREFERDYRFDPVRRFELDFAWLSDWVGLEIEGGIWTGGAHARGAGITRDIEKGNLLTLAGWRLIRATDEMVSNGDAIAMIERLLASGLEATRPHRRRLRSTSTPMRKARSARPV